MAVSAEPLVGVAEPSGALCGWLQTCCTNRVPRFTYRRVLLLGPLQIMQYAAFVVGGSEAERTVRQIRAFSTVPIIVAGVSRQIATVLDNGADVALDDVKDPDLIGAFVGRLLYERSMYRYEPERVHFDVIDVSRTGQVAFIGGRQVRLTAIQARMLYVLTCAAGAFVEMDALTDVVNALDPPMCVRFHIMRLRRLLGPDFIETSRGFGYRLTTSAERCDDQKEIA